MKTPKLSPCFRSESAASAPTLTHAFHAPQVAQRTRRGDALPLDEALASLVAETELSSTQLAHATGVAGSAAMLVFTRSSLALGHAFAFGVGLSPAQIANLAALDVSLLSVAVARAAQPTEASARAFRHGLYHVGAMQPRKVETAADRKRRELRLWSMPLDQLAAERKAVA